MEVHRTRRRKTAPRFPRKAAWICAAACLGAMACVAGAGLLESRAQTPTVQAGTNALAAAKPQPAMPDPRQKQIADDSANLLKLATALKTEVDKTTKDELSVSVVRKAGEIEQLAHRMRTR